MPDPITTAARNALPSNSASSRRHSATGSGGGVLVTAPILTDEDSSVKIESMNTEQMADVAARAAVHAALADPARLLITDTLAARRRLPVGPGGHARRCRPTCSPTICMCLSRPDCSPAAVPKGTAAAVTCSWYRACSIRSAAPRRAGRGGCCSCAPLTRRARIWRPRCGAGPVRSRRHQPEPILRPSIAPGALAAAGRHHLPLRRQRPRHISLVREDGDLVVTVCDRAREELGPLAAVHWSVPDPVPAGDPGSFDAALAELGQRIERFAPTLAAAP